MWNAQVAQIFLEDVPACALPSPVALNGWPCLPIPKDQDARVKIQALIADMDNHIYCSLFETVQSSGLHHDKIDLAQAHGDAISPFGPGSALWILITLLTLPEEGLAAAEFLQDALSAVNHLDPRNLAGYVTSIVLIHKQQQQITGPLSNPQLLGSVLVPLVLLNCYRSDDLAVRHIAEHHHLTHGPRRALRLNHGPGESVIAHTSATKDYYALSVVLDKFHALILTRPVTLPATGLLSAQRSHQSRVRVDSSLKRLGPPGSTSPVPRTGTVSPISLVGPFPAIPSPCCF